MSRDKVSCDHLVAALSANLCAVPRHGPARRLVIGLVIGGAVTLAALALGLGIRRDLADAMQSSGFWMKALYAATLAMFACAATLRLARPDCGRMRGLWAMAVPIALLALAALLELARTPGSQWLTMWLGHSWKVCAANVFLLALPILAGLLWALRRLAPTRLRLAGATAGLAAGAWAACLYCLHCSETSALFVLTWYSLGIVLVAGLGALLGPRVLRW
ncbi:hypothetical protein EDF56_106217 [Novosphingobium sp. PhB165]|uniref:DUF1109 domain-containing protein n=1 Tax=Novosphingobium sp. PhB165 TaxID=2485105 RepID=UPI0010514441|nr:DUF1109 domain-containing protein [Novosphingobium sp. PhB165]TCM17101.1 hypothetical protein EDF56_106217 [Novosphingobium sp. PhB165]